MAKSNSNVRRIGRKVEVSSPIPGKCTVNDLRHLDDEDDDETINWLGRRPVNPYTPPMNNELSDIVRQRCEEMGRSVKDSNSIATLLTVIVNAPSEKLDDVVRMVDVALNRDISKLAFGKSGRPPSPERTEARLRDKFQAALKEVAAAKSDEEILPHARPLVSAHDRLKARGVDVVGLGGTDELRLCRRILRSETARRAQPTL